ncbi:MAG: ABC transporter ATP-binding protein [Acidobacteriia bacterium]|nr:ABC transporter ATP-binding protein [Terriglobia bacterium]
MIDIEHVRKSYNGTRALDDFTLHVGRGELFGLVGPNGAGKTTLIKTLATLLRPQSGRVAIDGKDLTRNPQAIKRVVGYLPDQPGLYQEMSVREFLEFFADAFALRGDKRRSAVARALQRSGLEARSSAYVEELSFGMKQRLLLAKTLLHQPRVLLLDEPATGLDPIARIELRQQLRALNEEGVTILISSHILSDLEDICTNVALIAQGRNARDAEGRAVIPLREKQAKALVYEIEVLGDPAAAMVALTAAAGTRLLQQQGPTLLVEITGAASEAAALLRTLIAGGVSVVRFLARDVGLEEEYRRAFSPPGGKA